MCKCIQNVKIVAQGMLTGPKTLKKIKEKKPIHHLFPKRPKALSLSLSLSHSEILNEKY